MTDQQAVATVKPRRRRRVTSSKKPKQQPRYNVILWDSDDHSFHYVIAMMQRLFGYQQTRGFEIAAEVHTRGRAIVLTTTREHAELKRDQIHSFGKDELSDSCQGAMWSTIEPIS